MLRIRKITNPYHEANLRKIEAVKEIIRKQFPMISEKKIEEIDTQLADPIKYKYLSLIHI